MCISAGVLFFNSLLCVSINYPDVNSTLNHVSPLTTKKKLLNKITIPSSTTTNATCRRYAHPATINKFASRAPREHTCSPGREPKTATAEHQLGAGAADTGGTA